LLTQILNYKLLYKSQFSSELKVVFNDSKFRQFIASVNDQLKQVNFTTLPGWEVGYHTASGNRYYVENILEGLDTPGEWYLDSSNWRLYYYPFPWEDPQTAEFEVPILQV
jgi:hypothetical protein